MPDKYSIMYSPEDWSRRIGWGVVPEDRELVADPTATFTRTVTPAAETAPVAVKLGPPMQGSDYDRIIGIGPSILGCIYERS